MSARLAILGGTFDPIHIGHLAIAEDVRFALSADRVLFVPTAQQPLKASGHLATAQDRLAMVELAIADNPGFAASDLEIRRGGLSYTVDTVDQLREQHPNTELYFIVGADAALDLGRWFQVDRLLRLCRLAIVQRPGYEINLEAMLAELPALRERALVLEGPALDVSATELRRRLRLGQPVRYHLPPAVYRYIEEHGLYRDADSDDAA